MTEKAIVIADDHPVFRFGLSHIINNSEDFTVAGEAENTEQLFEVLEAVTCDIVILDMKMPENRDGILALQRIKKVYPQKKVMIISQMCSSALVQEAMNTGADGYITKSDITDMILPFLKCILNGEKIVSPKIQGMFMNIDSDMVEKLTSRENEVLQLSAEGLSRKDIASELGISISTVNFHRQNIKEKLQAKNLAGMIHLAQEKGLVE